METTVKEPRKVEAPRTPLETSAPARPRPRPRPILVLGGLSVAALAGLAYHAITTAGLEETDDAQVEADVVPVAPRVPGQLLRLEVAENKEVRRGDLILQIRPRGLRGPGGPGGGGARDGAGSGSGGGGPGASRHRVGLRRVGFRNGSGLRVDGGCDQRGVAGGGSPGGGRFEPGRMLGRPNSTSLGLGAWPRRAP